MGYRLAVCRAAGALASFGLVWNLWSAFIPFWPIFRVCELIRRDREPATHGRNPHTICPVMSEPARTLLRTIPAVTHDLRSLASSVMRSRAQLAAENLFLRKQLALYQERRVKPRRADDATRLILASLSRFLEWRLLL